MVTKGSGGGGNIGEPLDLTVTVVGTDATITWTDNEIGTIPPTSFAKSELVRKVGSAPTSPSDGTLVVTETVKDTYKNTGYVDSGLTDGTTYYYRVFSYSDLGGISYCDAVSVTPSSGWQPGANTIAYFPFVDDKSNIISGSNISISSSNIGITTVDGIKCLYFDGIETQSLDIGFRTQDITSVMVWIRGGYSGDILEQRNTSGGDDNRMFIIYNNQVQYLRYQSASAHIYGPTISSNVWHCIGITEDSSGGKIFLDGNNSAVATNSSTRTFSVLTTDTGLGCRVNNGVSDNPATGYMGGLVLMDAAITVADFLDYYDQTKANYGIS